jgi:hypothetical protein
MNYLISLPNNWSHPIGKEAKLHYDTQEQRFYAREELLRSLKSMFTLKATKTFPNSFAKFLLNKSVDYARIPEYEQDDYREEFTETILPELKRNIFGAFISLTENKENAGQKCESKNLPQ